MRQAIIVELSKLLRSRVSQIGGGALIIGVSLVCFSMFWGAQGHNPQVLAKLGPIDPTTWPGFFAMAMQVTRAGAPGAFGVAVCS